MSYAELNLAGPYRLSSPDRPETAPIRLPGDVHAALLEAGLIPDPYFGDNERKVMWVGRSRWDIEGVFQAVDVDGYLTLTIDQLDGVVRVLLNGEEIGQTDNTFIRHDFDVTGKVRRGSNWLRFEFAVAGDVARARHDAHPFEIPFTYNYLANGLEGVHMNFLRKPACHAGWDWGICLMPLGLYGQMRLRRSRLVRQDSVEIRQHHASNAVELAITTRLFAFASGVVDLRHECEGVVIEDKVVVQPGENAFTHRLSIEAPRLWWPSGQGDQPLYTVRTSVDGEATSRRIGLRRLDWVIEKDEVDHSFKCRVNGRDVTMMGANWIPADAMPSRITPERVRGLLESAVAANMNMIRVWGGGQYEPDWFYDLCDELGLLVWQDFMFSCMPYPADPAFLESVATEARQQVRRLMHHACLALWCGDNEVIGSLTWYPETRANRDRFVANYDRLNSLLAGIVAEDDPDRRFWPSSPSLGYLDFADGWHLDTRGDMHFWDVWHSARPFSAYRGVNPRFASEFGFQAFPAMKVIESFTTPADRNPSAPVMETHQRNEGGNARILETMTRYFRFPTSFEHVVYLSQVQQGLAIKTAVDYWRSTKPRCMGTLYWQLDDTWPVASWSSLDHGGGWRLLHYMAKRFYRPVNVVAVPAGDEIVLKGLNDGAGEASIDLVAEAVGLDGAVRRLASGRHDLPSERSLVLWRMPASRLGEQEWLRFRWSGDGIAPGDDDFMPRAYKAYDWPEARVRAAWSSGGGLPRLTLETDATALFVAADVDWPGRFSDNALTLLPGSAVAVDFLAAPGPAPDPVRLAETLTLRHLRQTY